MLLFKEPVRFGPTQGVKNILTQKKGPQTFVPGFRPDPKGPGSTLPPPGGMGGVPAGHTPHPRRGGGTGLKNDPGTYAVETFC